LCNIIPQYKKKEGKGKLYTNKGHVTNKQQQLNGKTHATPKGKLEKRRRNAHGGKGKLNELPFHTAMPYFEGDDAALTMWETRTKSIGSNHERKWEKRRGGRWSLKKLVYFTQTA